MDITSLLADPTAIIVEAVVPHGKSVTLVVRSIQPVAVCPLCRQPSASLHSNYMRTVADLPWHGVAVRLQLHARKFRCRNQLCERKVFCQRLPTVVAAGAGQTIRLDQALTLLAFVAGGETGARTACRLGLIVSGDTLLR